MMMPIISMLTGLLAGAAVTIAMLAWSRRRERRWAEAEAAQALDSAKKDAEAQSRCRNPTLKLTLAQVLYSIRAAEHRVKQTAGLVPDDDVRGRAKQ